MRDLYHTIPSGNCWSFENGSAGLQVWIAPGMGVAEDFVNVLKDLSSNSEVVMVAIFAIFAVVHSGLAYLRPWGTHLPPLS